MTENRPLYERQDWDTPAGWAFFKCYLAQDPPRSLVKAYNTYREEKKGAKEGLKKAKRVPGSFRNMAAGKNRDGTPRPFAVPFTKRVRAYEDYLDELERKKWTERRLKLREMEWNIGEKILEKAQNMLLFPVMVNDTEKTEDGTIIHRIMPAGWSFKDIPGMLSTASKIARLAADMPTKQVKLDWRSEAEKDGIDPDEFYRNALKNIQKELDGGSASGGVPGSQEISQGEEEQGG